MNIEELKAKLRKMKVLAIRGEFGERDVAERMIEKIAERYGLSLEFLDESHERKFYINFSTVWQRGLFVQLLGLMRIERYGDRNADKLNLYYTRGRSRMKCHVVCMEGEWLEVCAKYAVLKEDYKRQHDAFYRAFLIANDLLMPFDPNARVTDRERKKSELAIALSGGIKPSEFYEQIGLEGGEA